MPHGQKNKKWKEQTNKQKNLQPKKQERKQQDTAMHTIAFPQAFHSFHSRTEKMLERKWQRWRKCWHLSWLCSRRWCKYLTAVTYWVATPLFYRLGNGALEGINNLLKILWSQTERPDLSQTKQTPEPLFLASLPVSLSVGSCRLRCFTILCDIVETDAI